MKATGELIDRVTGKKLKVTVETDNIDGYMNISFEGYGDNSSIDGDGAPVTIDFFDDKLQVIVWGDINEVDPTQFINLEGARECNRIKDHNKAIASQDDD